MLEERPEAGGACENSEPIPGVRITPHAMCMYAGPAPGFEQLELHKYGFRMDWSGAVSENLESAKPRRNRHWHDWRQLGHRECAVEVRDTGIAMNEETGKNVSRLSCHQGRNGKRIGLDADTAYSKASQSRDRGGTRAWKRLQVPHSSSSGEDKHEPRSERWASGSWSSMTTGMR